MLRRIVIIALVIAVIGLIINDASRYASAQRLLRDTTYDLATWAAGEATPTNRDAVAGDIAAMAAEKGVRVYQYGQSDQSVQVWAETTVEGTIVAGIVYNLFAGVPPAQVMDAEFIIKDYREAGIQ